jgi:hypothetical protein
MVLYSFHTFRLLEKLHGYQIASANWLIDIYKVIPTLATFIVLRVGRDGSLLRGLHFVRAIIIWPWGLSLRDRWGAIPTNVSSQLMNLELIPRSGCRSWWSIMFTYYCYLHPFASGRPLSTKSMSSLFWWCWPHLLREPSPKTHGSAAFCPAGRASSMASSTQTLKLEIQT